jgi:hypothetical protein
MLGTTTSKTRPGRQAILANEEPRQPELDRALATWENEGGSVILRPNRPDEANTGSGIPERNNAALPHEAAD